MYTDKLTVWVEDGCLKAHLRGQKWVFGGKGKARAEEAPTTVISSFPAFLWEALFTSIELCVIIYHEHHFPLEDIAVHQPTADP